MRLKSIFKLDLPTTFNGTVLGWAKANDSDFDLGSESDPVTLTRTSSGSDEWTGEFESNSPIESVGVFDIDWTWTIEINGAKLKDSSSHTILSALATAESFSNAIDPGGNSVDNGDVNAGSGPVVFALADAPTTRPYQTLQEWTSKEAEGLTGNEQILDKLISKTGLEKLGQYSLDAVNHPKPYSVEALLATGKGSCGNWSDVFDQAAASMNIDVKRVAVKAFPKGDPQSLNPRLYAAGWKTKNAATIGNAAKTYYFGDHEWCEYTLNGKSVVFDPSYGVKWDQGPNPGRSYAEDMMVGFYFYPLNTPANQLPQKTDDWSMPSTEIAPANKLYAAGYGATNARISLRRSIDGAGVPANEDQYYWWSTVVPAAPAAPNP